MCLTSADKCARCVQKLAEAFISKYAISAMTTVYRFFYCFFFFPLRSIAVCFSSPKPWAAVTITFAARACAGRCIAIARHRRRESENAQQRTRNAGGCSCSSGVTADPGSDLNGRRLSHAVAARRRRRCRCHRVRVQVPAAANGDRGWRCYKQGRPRRTVTAGGGATNRDGGGGGGGQRK